MSMTGLFGATFGIDRSIFRRVFDVTDHWFPAACAMAITTRRR